MMEKDDIIFDSYVKGILLLRDETDLEDFLTQMEHDTELTSYDLLRLYRIIRVWKVRK